MLCLVQDDEDETDSSKVDQGQEVSEDRKPEQQQQQNPIVGKASNNRASTDLDWTPV